jgi:hypothetical protein
MQQTPSVTPRLRLAPLARPKCTKPSPKGMFRSFGSPAFSGVWARPLAFRPRLTAWLALSGTSTMGLCCLVSPPTLEKLLNQSKLHSNWGIHLSLKQSPFCEPQRSQNVQAQRRGMHGMVKHMDVVRSVNLSDLLSHMAALGVWEHTWPMRESAMDRIVIRKEFRHSRRTTGAHWTVGPRLG